MLRTISDTKRVPVKHDKASILKKNQHLTTACEGLHCFCPSVHLHAISYLQTKYHLTNYQCEATTKRKFWGDQEDYAKI